jgi:hypothetical protein
MRNTNNVTGFAACVLLLSCSALTVGRAENVGLNARVALLDEGRDGRSREHLVSARRTFYDGQRFRLRIEAGRPGYVYVLCQTSQGNVVLLSPAQASDNFIDGGTVSSLPIRGWFRFDREPGAERLYIVLSEQPITELDDAAERGSELSPSTLRQYTTDALVENGNDSVTRGIEVDTVSERIVKRLILRHESREAWPE